MKSTLLVAIVMGLVCALTGCAGNGEGLDENGRPIDEAGPPINSDFAQIQSTIFTPVCTNCHAGASAPLGLRLDEGNSYALLFGVPSVEVPALQRVQPGNPDTSYLVQKIEGTAAVGERMPLGGPPLPQSSIDLVRQWISQGAPSGADDPASTSQPLKVASTIPAADEEVEPIAEVMVVFNHPVDASLASADTFTLVGSGGDESFGESNDVPVKLRAIEVSLVNPTVVRLMLAGPLPPDAYRLTIGGSGGTVLASVDNRLLDGDHEMIFAVAEAVR